MTQLIKNVLCFGDSNTWGLNCETGKRFDEHTRWTSLLNQQLGSEYKVIEAGQPNRTLVKKPPFSGALNGISYLKPYLEQHVVSTIVIALGTNDLKKRFDLSPVKIASGLASLITSIKHFYADAELPNIVLFGPLFISPQPPLRDIYLNCEDKLAPLSICFKHVANEHTLRYVDLSPLTTLLAIDGIHLSSQGHKRLSEIVTDVICSL